MSSSIAISNKAIVLVGPMGAGKTSVAQQLAKKMDCCHVDADDYLEKKLGVPLAWVVEKEGESGFRQRESDCLHDMLVEYKNQTFCAFYRRWRGV